MAQSKAAMEQERNEAKEIVQQLQNVFECPICLAFARSDFILCTSGHVICGYCADRVNRCPLCQGKLDMKNPLVLKKLVELLPRKCKYHDYGCTETLSPEGTSQHEKFCGFRLVYCHLVYKRVYQSAVPHCTPRLRQNVNGRIMSCKDMIPLNELAAHYATAHPKETFFQADRNVVTLNGQFDFRWVDEMLILPFFAPHNVFWLVCSNKFNNNFKIVSIVSPIGEWAAEPFVRIGFQKGDFVETRTLQPNLEEGENSLDEPEKNRACVQVIHPCPFKNDDGSLTFTVDLFEKEIKEEKCKKHHSVFELAKRFKKNFFSCPSGSVPNDGQ